MMDQRHVALILGTGTNQQPLTHAFRLSRQYTSALRILSSVPVCLFKYLLKSICNLHDIEGLVRIFARTSPRCDSAHVVAEKIPYCINELQLISRIYNNS